MNASSPDIRNRALADQGGRGVFTEEQQRYLSSWEEGS
jgi:hypothetical protein